MQLQVPQISQILSYYWDIIVGYNHLIFSEILNVWFVFSFTHWGTNKLVSFCMPNLREYLSCWLHQTGFKVSALPTHNSLLVY